MNLDLPIIDISDKSNYRLKIGFDTNIKPYTDTITDIFLLDKINIFLKLCDTNITYAVFQKSNYSNDYGICITCSNNNKINDIYKAINDTNLKVFCYIDNKSSDTVYLTDNKRIRYKYYNFDWYCSLDSFIQVNAKAGEYIHELVKKIICNNNKNNNYIYALGGESGVYSKGLLAKEYLCLTNSKAIYEDCIYNGQKDTVLIDYDTVLLKDYIVIKSSILIVNISRNGLRGLANQVIDKDMDFIKIVYIGCFDKAVMRDCNILGKNYKIVTIEKINQFPNTNHYLYVIEFVKI